VRPRGCDVCEYPFSGGSKPPATRVFQDYRNLPVLEELLPVRESSCGSVRACLVTRGPR
jgi:hypothetical protein